MHYMVHYMVHYIVHYMVHYIVHYIVYLEPLYNDYRKARRRPRGG